MYHVVERKCSLKQARVSGVNCNLVYPSSQQISIREKTATQSTAFLGTLSGDVMDQKKVVMF